MKNWLLLSFLIPLAASAQIGINTTTPNAMLEVNSTTNGILIPRVSLTSAVDVVTDVNPQGGALATSTLIYNTTPSGTGFNAIIAGFYYWNGSRWSPVGNGQDWTLCGNTNSTDPAAPTIYGSTPIAATENFLGTTDAQALVLGTASLERMRLGTTGNVGIGTAAPAQRLHVVNNSNASKSTIMAEADQTTTGTDHNNIGITGYSTGEAEWGLGAGLVGIGNTITSNYYASGVVAALGTTATATLPNSNQALYADGNNQGHSARFLNGPIQYVNGTLGSGRVLTSDASGNASWQQPGIDNVIGTLGAGVNVPYNASTWLYTGSILTLPPGRYAVQVSMLMAPNAMLASNASIWVRTTFCDTAAATTYSPDIQGSYLISGNMDGQATYGLINGMIIIINTSGANKNYYYKAGMTVPWNATSTLMSLGGGWDEDTIVAFRLN